MNQYILVDMITERLKREIGMVAESMPEEITTLQADLPSGKIHFENALYQAEKLKKISTGKRDLGESGAGSVVMFVADDEYDIPFTLVDIAFGFTGKGKVMATFQMRPLVKDEESTRKYITPFQQWYEAICSLPSEPYNFEEGEFLKDNPLPLLHMRSLDDDYTDEVLKFTDHFFDIFLDIYRKAEPVKDPKRKREMEAFRSEYNEKILANDYSGIMLTEIFGQQTAALLYDYWIYL
jgi:hypothetical protein